MVVVAAGREEGRLASETRRHVEAEDVAVEGHCPVEVGDLEVHVADIRAGIESV